MKKLTAGIFCTLLMTVAGAARADIASKRYVDKIVESYATTESVEAKTGDLDFKGTKAGGAEDLTEAVNALDTAIASVESSVSDIESGIDGKISAAVADKQDANTAVKHTAGSAVGSASQPVYIDANGNAVAGNNINDTTITITTNKGTETFTTNTDTAKTIDLSYTLPTATSSELGGVKIDNDTIKISDGVISVNSDALAIEGTEYGAGDGLDLSEDEKFSVKAGNGIDVSESGVAVKSGNGITVDTSGVAVSAATNGGITVDANGVAVKTATSGGLTVDADGVKVDDTVITTSNVDSKIETYLTTNATNTVNVAEKGQVVTGITQTNGKITAVASEKLALADIDISALATTTTKDATLVVVYKDGGLKLEPIVLDDID